MAVTLNSSEAFDIDAIKYKCCCGCMHVKRGAGVIALFTIVGQLGRLIQAWILVSNAVTQETDCTLKEVRDGMCEGYVDTTAIWVNFAFSAFFVIVGFLLLIGVIKEIPCLILPFMVYLVITMIYCGISAAVVLMYGPDIIYMDGEGSKVERSPLKEGFKEVTLSFVVISAMFVVAIWFFCVTLKCYRYLKDLKVVKAGYSAGVPMATYQAPQQLPESPATQPMEYGKGFPYHEQQPGASTSQQPIPASAPMAEELPEKAYPPLANYPPATPNAPPMPAPPPYSEKPPAYPE